MARHALVLALALRGAAAITPSAGCGSSAHISTGSTFSATLTSGGVERSYTAFLPDEYDASTPMPLVMSIHGMGGTSLEDACDSGTTAVAKDTGAFMVVHPQGMDDIDKKNPSSWTSWHFNGTCQNGGVSCDTSKNNDNYCYESNPDCQDCDWTSCVDDVTFLTELYDYMEANYCVDLDRMYATGQSNGGMMTYQIGATLAHRLAAIAPISGSLHWNYAVQPTEPIPVFAVTGTQDSTVPANGTANGKTSDGTWWYLSMDALAANWADAQECDGASAPYTTSFDGVDELWCKTACGNIDHVLCAWNGNHNYFTGPKMNYIYTCTPENLSETYYQNGQLVWEFFSKHSRASASSVAIVAIANETVVVA